jgi:hypothetical protein
MSVALGNRVIPAQAAADSQIPAPNLGWLAELD